MQRIGWVIALCAMLFAIPASAAGSIVARIDLSDQLMHVFVNGIERFAWPVSTARRGYHTPIGSFRPIRLEKMWYSRKYHHSPMPHSIFFLGGYAVHGTNVIRRLGTPASHGCVRLHPSNAAELFSLVRQYGMGHTRIVVTR